MSLSTSLFVAFLCVMRSVTPEVVALRIPPSRIQKYQLLDEEQCKPLFPPEMMDISARSSAPRADATGGTAVMVYHKTGCLFAYKFLPKLGVQYKYHNNMTTHEFSHGKAGKSFYESPVEERWPLVVNPSRTMPIPANMRILHFYRNPVSKLLSGYRYHSQNPQIERSWERKQNTCNHCDPDAHAAVFSACDYGCSYAQLLQSVDAHRGLAFEAVHARQELQHMVGNLQRWANNKDALHISMEHLAVSFDDTLTCILKFLANQSEMPDGGNGKNVDAFRDLDISADSEHVTHDKYNNTELQTWLYTHEHWGPQLRELQDQEKKIWARQALLYGCPEPA